MADPVADTLAGLPSTVLRTGQVIKTAAGALAVSLGGTVQPARWADPVVVREGDPVLVALVSGGLGQSEAIVLARLATSPRPGEASVTAAPVGSATITVAADGVSYTAKFVGSYTPVVGDLVALSWQASVPYVIGEVGTTTAPTPPPAPVPPPGPSGSGTGRYAAIDSGTWNVTLGNWSSTHANSVVQGTYGGYTYTGAWFYGTSPAELTGRTITAVRFRLPGRRRIGSHNAAAAMHLYLHTSPARGGEPARIDGPTDFTVPPGYGGGDLVALPTGWGAQLVAGGGIAVAGSPYAGFAGRGDDPESGRVELDWA